MRTAEAIVDKGANTYHNLAFHFLRLYHFLFRRITHGSSRLQEVLADRVAVHLYGAAAFREGLKHVIRQDIAFHTLAGTEVDLAISQNRKISNIYFLGKPDENDASEIDRQTDEILNLPTTEDDTHPSPVDRFRHAEKIVGQALPGVSGEVWDLFADRDGISQSMSEMVEERVRAIRFGSSHDMLS
jgi:Zn-dependent protease with chaperone function